MHESCDLSTKACRPCKRALRQHLRLHQNNRGSLSAQDTRRPALSAVNPSRHEPPCGALLTRFLSLLAQYGTCYSSPLLAWAAIDERRCEAARLRSAAAPQPPQALFKQRLDRRGKRELPGLFTTARRHLVPSLGQNVGELVGIGLGQEIGDVVLKEHDAGHVLDQLRFGVRFEPLLADERTDARDVVRAITLRGHDFADAPGVKGLQVLAPFQVPRAAGRVARA